MGKRLNKKGGNDTYDTTDIETTSSTDNSELNIGFIEDTSSSTITESADTYGESIKDDNIFNDNIEVYGALPNGGGKRKSRRKGKKSTRKGKKSKKRVTKRRRFYGGQPASPASNWIMTSTNIIEPTFKLSE